jgi:hypothetical protein
VLITVIHDEFEEDSEVYRACSEGWPMLMSSRKTLLETGKPLPEFEFEVESDVRRATTNRCNRDRAANFLPEAQSSLSRVMGRSRIRLPVA